MNNLDQSQLKEIPKFEALINIEIVNFKTGETCRMIGGIDMNFFDEDTSTIAKICSQEEIYNLLFKKKLNGRPYTEEDAGGFMSWVKKGWEDGTHFVFIVRDGKSHVVGAIDIKSPNFENAEVGYWADEEASGFMTNALQSLEAIAAKAGYKSLYAQVITHNEKSMGVLVRAGFTKRNESKIIEDRTYEEFDKRLV